MKINLTIFISLTSNEDGLFMPFFDYWMKMDYFYLYIQSKKEKTKIC